MGWYSGELKVPRHTAHRLATQAQEQIDEISAKVAFLSADIDLLKVGSEREDAQQQLRGLSQKLEDARRALEQQRQVVRDLASEYRAASAAAQGSYHTNTHR